MSLYAKMQELTAAAVAEGRASEWVDMSWLAEELSYRRRT